MDFAQFLAPFDPERFDAEHWDRRPLHIPAGPDGARIGLLDWPRLAALLEIVPHWVDGSLRLIMDSRPVAPEHYRVVRESGRGPVERPDPGLVEAMIALGASLVADRVEDASPELRAVCAMLGSRFAAKAGVNVYASRRGVQAFASHCDPHEVFAVQCDGEKRWRIYARRADSPVQSSLLADQGAIDAAKGPVLLEVDMRPGDLLYIPRGFYHDAVASSARSLHLTFGVQPLYGAAVLDTLRDLVLTDPLFRAYLPPAGPALQARLGELGKRLAAVLSSPAAHEDVAVRQRVLAPHPTGSGMADDARPVLLARTAGGCRIEQPLDGSYLEVGGEKRELGLLSDAAAWLIGQHVFSEAQLYARFSHHPRDELARLLGEFRRLGLLTEYAG